VRRAAIALCLLLSACDGAEALVGDVPRPESTVTSAVRLGHGVQAVATRDGMARVEVHVRPMIVAQGGVVQVWLENTGDVQLAYATFYRIHRRDAGKWRREPNHAAFTLLLSSLFPGTSSEAQDVYVVDRHQRSRALEPGLYRVSKEVEVGSSNATMTVGATFRVVRSS
jgi:hypothetical protein